MRVSSDLIFYYTIPSDNRELQLSESSQSLTSDYTIPSDNRELQRLPHRM